jgi:hypothetical protein
MELQEIFYATMVELGGGRYRGVQKGEPHLGLEPLILFDSPSASLALRASELSAEAVRRVIAAKEEEFAAFERVPEQVFAGAAQ